MTQRTSWTVLFLHLPQQHLPARRPSTPGSMQVPLLQCQTTSQVTTKAPLHRYRIVGSGRATLSLRYQPCETPQSSGRTPPHLAPSDPRHKNRLARCQSFQPSLAEVDNLRWQCILLPPLGIPKKSPLRRNENSPTEAGNITLDHIAARRVDTRSLQVRIHPDSHPVVESLLPCLPAKTPLHLPRPLQEEVSTPWWISAKSW